MTPGGRVVCSSCRGAGYVHPAPAPLAWLRCSACDGTGKAWEPGAPRYGCKLALVDCAPGEHVTLGTGERVCVAWHEPSKSKGKPRYTFVSPISDFDDSVDTTRTDAYSPELGVAGVSIRIAGGELDRHDHDKDSDLVDPMARARDQRAALL